MYGHGSTSAYRDTEILSSSAERLVPVLYEHLLVSLKRGAMQVRDRDIAGKAESLTRAQDIVAELMASLDFEAGGDLAGALAALYGYWMKEILAAGRDLDAARLDQVGTMVASLHAAWDEAARTAEPASAPRGGRREA